MRNINHCIINKYDIRGIYGAELNEEFALMIGRAFGSYIRGKGISKICVGRDGRDSSYKLEQELVRGLVISGCSVIKLGLVPTPLVFFAQKHLKICSGIMITASHNESSFNGFKMTHNFEPFSGSDIESILDQILTQGEGAESEFDILPHYLQALLPTVNSSKLKIVWDPGNGASCALVKEISQELGGEHVVINYIIDGRFSGRGADPTKQGSLIELSEQIIKRQFDLGIAFDGDGDRIVVLDKKGEKVSPENLGLLFARDIIKDNPGSKFIGDIKHGEEFFEEIEKLGGEAIMSPTGHSIIKKMLKEKNAIFACEVSGHIYFADRFLGIDDAVYAALRLINILNSSKSILSEFKGRYNSKEIFVPCKNKFDIIEKIKKKNQGNYLDGIRVKEKDGWWLIRASNTNNGLVVRYGAKNIESFNRIKKNVDEILKNELR